MINSATQNFMEANNQLFRCIQDRKLIMALSRIDTTNMIEDVPQSKIDNNINFRNIIINGDMSIAQRGTSASWITVVVIIQLIDLEMSNSWNLDTITINRCSNWSRFCKIIKMDCTTADASPAAEIYYN